MSIDCWHKKELGNILKLNYGWSLPEKNRILGEFQVYGSNGVVGNHNQPLVNSSGLIVGRKGSAGNIHYSRKPFCPIDTTFFITQKDTELDLDFLYFLLLHLNLKRIQGDVGVPGLNREMAYKEKACFPVAKDEQQKIAYVLSTVQTAIEQQARMIKLTQELKTALIHKLFTEGLRGEKQKETEIGPVPESWEGTTLVELTKSNGLIQTGPFGSQLHKSDYQDCGIPVVNPTHLTGNKISHGNLSRISHDTAKGLAKHILKTGDIVFGRRGEIGRHGFVSKNEDGWFCGTGSFLVRVNKNHIENRYLSYYFSLPKIVTWLNAHAAGVIMPNLNNTVLGLMPVFYPDYETQVEIVNALNTIEEKIELSEKKRSLLEELFRMLLNQLMTGRIRVNDIDLPGFEGGEDGEKRD